MPAGDMADGISHNHDGEAEGQRYPKQADATRIEACREHRAATTAKDEDERPENFRDQIPLHLRNLPESLQ
jgi:hypothetical protein